MRKTSNISLFAVVVVLGTILISCSGYDGNKNSNNKNITDSADNNSNENKISDDNDTTDSLENNSNDTNTSTFSECIICDDYAIADTFSIDGVTYTVADEMMLTNKVQDGDDISALCTSKITDMSYLFYGFRDFNQDISRWDVSNVTQMQGMFTYADSFNQDLSGWGVSNVTIMY
jgi:surface protein